MGREAENVAAVRELFDAVNRAGRWTVVADRVGPDFEFESDPRHPQAGVYRGADEYRRFLEEFEEPYERTTAALEDVFARGDEVVTYALVMRKPYGSSVVIENRLGFWWTFRDGRIVREQAFGERERALEAAGLGEDDAVAP